MQAVILSAGKGVRLRPITNSIPKALIAVNGKPLLQRILEALPDEVDEIIIVVGYLADQITQRFGNTWNGRPIRYVVQDPLTGTGGALHLAKDFLRDRFLVINGDDLYAKADLERLIAHPFGILLLRTDALIRTSALVDEQGRFEGLEEKAPAQETKLRVCGAYVMDERFFKYPLTEIQVGGHREWGLPQTLIRVTGDIDVRAEYATSWMPVGTPDELDRARKMTS
jgi:bifunctional UDP-N-acetylglucosamine pyrophosphorylase/glucosamine-1-phosphate N-acetyltransferase